jgi:AraC-like DNA-binding protein
VSKAIARIRSDYNMHIPVADLAATAGMSQSTFHEHFKTVTASSPLQYQKELRLLEAQRLLRAKDKTVSAVAFEVGYESPTQFSREYARKFGVPPKQEKVSHTA